jgi:hypothetical protein
MALPSFFSLFFILTCEVSTSVIPFISNKQPRSRLYQTCRQTDSSSKKNVSYTSHCPYQNIIDIEIIRQLTL